MFSKKWPCLYSGSLKNMFVSVFLLQKQYMAKGEKKKIKKGVTENHLWSFQTIITGVYHFHLNF